LAPNYEFLYIQYKDCNKILIHVQRKTCWIKRSIFKMIHALIHKIDKGDSILATFTTNELAQLTVLHFKRQIKFMSY
jgi:hypothetical protein